MVLSVNQLLLKFRFDLLYSYENRHGLSSYLEYPCYCGQQGAEQHHIKGLRCQKDFSQVLRGAVCQRVGGRPLTASGSAATRQPLRPRGEFVTDVFSDGLSVGDRQKAVLLVGALQDFGCRLANGERA